MTWSSELTWQHQCLHRSAASPAWLTPKRDRPDLIYLNHASIGTVPEPVHRAHVGYLELCESYPSLYVWGSVWREVTEETRRQVAAMLRCEPDDLAIHHQRGSIFENYVITEHLKRQHHAGIRPSAYFWRDRSGHEVDLIIEEGETFRATEIKSTETLNPDLFSGLKWFCSHTGLSPENCTLVYGGDQEQSRSAGHVLPWKQAHCL